MANGIQTIRASLHKALKKLGEANGHTCPQDGGNHEPILHELFIASEGEAYFKKRRELALTAMRAHVVSTNNGVDEIDLVAPGTEQVVLNGTFYSLTVKKNNPSKRINTKQVENNLRKLGWSDEDVLRFIDDCSVTTKPATTIKAIGN